MRGLFHTQDSILYTRTLCHVTPQSLERSCLSKVSSVLYTRTLRDVNPKYLERSCLFIGNANRKVSCIHRTYVMPFQNGLCTSNKSFVYLQFVCLCMLLYTCICVYVRVYACMCVYSLHLCTCIICNYGVASVSRINEIIGFFCKKAL